ncbi:MAG: ABC transporter ATP-binding protein [Proteobacteria bacterium]|jgi:ABC-2 type transport system ATP-binding protein|nr:ABC transporter ATP-binding protein [Pseudomonadota bacterium]
MTTAPILEVQDLFKTFRTGFFRRRVDAVRGVSFEVREGEIFGLLGPNGAGKTTTLKVMMGLVAPTSGSIRIFGRPCSEPGARARVGFLPENPYFHEYLTPRELLEFYGSLVGLGGAKLERQSEALIEQVGLKEAANRPLRKFSKGMLQRIGLAQALLGDPELLVLDEPMSGLDPIGRKFVADLIAERNRSGVAILFSSHILSDVERLCHRVVILNRGVVAAQGSLADLVGKDTGDETLESLFVRKALEGGGPESP